MKFSKNHLSLILEYIILESKAARQWINKNVDPEDLTEGADLLIAYNSGIMDISILSWIKKIRKIVPKNYRELGIPLSAGEVSREGIPLFEKSIEISFIVEAINQFRKPKYQTIFKANGYPTNLSTKNFPDILALVSANAQVEGAIKAKEALKSRKKSGDASLNYDPTSVDLIGDFGPWTVLMPNTVGGSISCDMSTVKTTTWCTTKAKGQNLFLSYVGASDKDIVLFYVMDYSRTPDNPKITRENSGTHNNDSRMSIGFVGGEPSFTGDHGSLSVDASNSGLTEKVVKEKLGLFYPAIMSAVTRKAQLVGSNHPAKVVKKNAASNLLVLKEIIKDYTPEAKLSFFSDMTSYYRHKPEDFSPRVVDYMTFGVTHEQHQSMLPGYIKDADAQQIAKYVDMIERSNGSEAWMKHSSFDDNTEIVDDDFNVVTNTLNHRKWSCLHTVLGRFGYGTKLPKDLFSRVYLLAREYFKEHVPEFRRFLPPGIAPEEEIKGYHSDQFIYGTLQAVGVTSDDIPEELKVNLEKIKELQTSEAYFQTIKQSIQDLKLTEYERAPNYITDTITDIAGFNTSKTETSLQNGERFNIKENIRKFFAMHKAYDDKGVKNRKRSFPPELNFSARTYDVITRSRNEGNHHNHAGVSEDILGSDPYISDYDSLIDYLFKLFPSLKELPLMMLDASEKYLDDKGSFGVHRAGLLIGSIIKANASPGTVKKVFDMSSGYFYNYLMFTQKNYSIPSSIYVDFFDNVKTDLLGGDDCMHFVKGLGDVLIKRTLRKYLISKNMSLNILYQGANFFSSDIYKDTPEYQAMLRIKEMMKEKIKDHGITNTDEHMIRLFGSA